MRSPPKAGSRIVLAFFAGVVFVLVTVAATGVGAGLVVAVLLGLAITAVGWVLADRRGLGVELPDHRIVRALWIGLAVLAIVQTVRLGIFTVSPNRANAAATPWSPFVTNHSCATAYFEAARLARDGEPNVYTPKLYTPTPAGRFIDRFRVDRYEYPPPFLLLPKLFAAQDFLRFRSLWFGFDGAMMLGALLALAWFVGGTEGRAIGLWAPVVWLSVPLQSTLQMGNFQLAAIGMCVLAMIAVARNRPALGGALLAFATISKLHPAFLVLWLVARRDWRAVGWTAAWAVVFSLVTLAWLGWAPYDAFLHYQLPRLASGEAFGMLRNPVVVALNDSVYGLVLKVQHFGVPSMSFRVASIVAWIYTAVLVVVIARTARRDRSAVESAGAWLAIIVLATMRSPFLPQELALFPPLWALGVLASQWKRWTPSSIAAFAGAAIALNACWPVEMKVRYGILVAIATIPQILAIAIAVVLLHRKAAESF